MTLWVRASTCELPEDTVQAPAPTLLEFRCNLKVRVLVLLLNIYNPIRFSISFSSSSGKNGVSTEEVESRGVEETSTQHPIFSSHVSFWLFPGTGACPHLLWWLGIVLGLTSKAINYLRMKNSTKLSTRIIVLAFTRHVM